MSQIGKERTLTMTSTFDPALIALAGAAIGLPLAYAPVSVSHCSGRRLRGPVTRNERWECAEFPLGHFKLETAAHEDDL